MSLAEVCLIISLKSHWSIGWHLQRMEGDSKRAGLGRSYGLYASTKPSAPSCGSRNLSSSHSRFRPEPLSLSSSGGRISVGQDAVSPLVLVGGGRGR